MVKIYHKKRLVATVNSYESALTWIALISQMTRFFNFTPYKYRICLTENNTTQHNTNKNEN